jgi:hypothetical protein
VTKKQDTRARAKSKAPPPPARAVDLSISIAVAEGLVSRFSAYAETLKIARESSDGWLHIEEIPLWVEQIHAAERAVASIGNSSEALRCAFFSLVQEVADAQMQKSDGDSRVVVDAVQRNSILLQGAAAYVKARLALLDRELADRTPAAHLAEVVNACLSPPPGGKWPVLVRTWHKMTGENIDATSAKNAMSKARDSAGNRRT